VPVNRQFRLRIHALNLSGTQEHFYAQILSPRYPLQFYLEARNPENGSKAANLFVCPRKFPEMIVCVSPRLAR
jgi:hypothetical protein